MSKSAIKNKHSTQLITRFSLLALFCLGLMFSQCARIQAPTGGPKDTLPPVLLYSTPPDSTLHYDADEIHFEFNEFIRLKDIRKQMIISPTPKNNPEITSKLETLTIEWVNKDSLKPNTTYIVNLGDAITDLNEGNVLEGFRYVFSTGDHLDSLEIRGRVIEARTGLPDSTAIVMLYDKMEDSIVSKEKPLYYTRCNGDGSFRFQNLPADTFKIFVLKDENGDLKYRGNEEIAFRKNPIRLEKNESGFLLSLFYAKPPEKKKENNQGGNKKEKEDSLIYSTSLNGKLQDLKQPLVLTFNHPLKTLTKSGITLQEDTTHQEIAFKIKRDTTFTENMRVAVDSSMNRDTTITRDTAVYAIELLYNWKEKTPYRLLIDSAFAIDTSGAVYAHSDTLQFTSKAKSEYGTLSLKFDTSQIFRIDSSSSLVASTSGTLKKDTLSTLSQDTSSPTPLKPTDSLHNTVDSLGNTADSLNFATDSLPADSLRMKKSQPQSDTASYQLVIELYKGEKMIESKPLKGNTWRKAYLDPGNYKIRVVKDENKNGKWDRGCYYCKDKRQPEKVYSLPNAYKVRANWDNANEDLKIRFESGR